MLHVSRVLLHNERMELSEFIIGSEFRCGENIYRCTDIGTRVIVAIRINPIERTVFDTATRTKVTETISYQQAESEGWLDGPPYIVAEFVFDEDEQEACEAIELLPK